MQCVLWTQGFPDLPVFYSSFAISHHIGLITAPHLSNPPLVSNDNPSISI